MNHQPSLSIHLQQLEFFAYHGLYEQEKLNGNNFIVDVDVETTIEEKITSVGQTIDYVTLYEIISKRMAVATPLLETLAQEMVEELLAADSRIRSISLSVKKLTPPIANFKGTVGVQIKKVVR